MSSYLLSSIVVHGNVLARNNARTFLETTMSKRQHTDNKNVPNVKQRARFTSSNGSTLTIQLRQGRRGGFNVSAALRKSGQKTQIGARRAFAQLPDAQKEFTKLAEDAKQQGWMELARNVGGVGAFAAVPSAE